MTIARPSHGVASNGKDNYRLNRVGGVIRPRCSTESPLLSRVSRVQQRTGQQQTYSTWNLFNKSFAARRGLAEPCQAASVTTQATVIKVRFAFHHQVPFGQELKLVGGCPELGNWQSERAQELQWNEGHVWTGDFSLEPGSYEFKCVVAAGNSILEWEPGANRILQVPGGVRGIRVEGSWSRTADNRVIVTEPIAAASVAARQKRAAAARLLTKALAQVNAAAAASGPASAAAAEARGAGREKAAAGAGAASGSGGGSDVSKRSAAEALEQEALRELQALLSPGGSDAGTWTASIPGDARGGGSGEASGRKAATAASGGSSSDSDSATVGEASNGKLPGAHGNGVGLVAAGGERGANSSNSDKARGPSTSATASTAVELRSQPAVSRVSSLGRSGGAGKARGWREAISESIDGAREQDQRQQQPQAREERKEQEQRQPSASEATAASASAGGIAQSIREAAAARGEPLADRRDAASSVQQGAGVGSGGPASVPEPDQRPRLAAEPKAAAKEQQQQPLVAKAAAKAEDSKAAAVVAAAEAAEAKAAAAGKSATAAEVKAAAPVKEAAAAAAKAAAAAVAGPQEKEQKKAETSLPVSPVVPAAAAAAAAVQAAGVAAAPKAAAAAGVAPAARSGGSGLDKVGGVVSSPSDQQKQEVKQPAATQGGVIEASANAASGKAGAKVAKASSVVTTAESKAGDSSNKSSSSSSSGGKARGLSWRQLLDDKEAEQPTAAKVKERPEPERKPVQSDKAPEEAQPAAKQGEDKGAASKVEQEKAEEEQGVSARFARLLASRLGGNKSQAPSPNAPTAAAGTADKQVGNSKQASAKRPQEPLKKEASSAATKPPKEPESAIAATSVKASAPATPPGRDNKASAAPPAAAAPGNAASGQSSSSSSSVNGKDQGADETAAGMGVVSSRDGRRVETLSNPDLDRIVDAWDAAWSKGRPKQEAGAAPSAPPASSSSNSNNSDNDGGARVTTAAPTKGGVSANGSAGRGGAAWPSLVAASGSGGSAPATTGRAPLPPSGLTSALGGGGAAAAAGAASAAAAAGATGKIANGSPVSGAGAAVGGSSGSGESLYSIAERLTGGNGPAAAAAPPNGPSSAESSPGITVRLGAMAAMGVDRQGSYDNRSSYLSQSLLAESVSMSGSGSGAGSAEQPATALLRQLRAANAANAAKGANSAAATSVPNLPATPAPPGILSSVDDDENGDVVPPLPATPPPPSYLSGPSGGGGGAAAAGAVPPLPATPVASSVLSGSFGGIGSAAEDLLRRAADADAVLNMLRGNLPLTPVARGGRGGAAGPLSMLEADEDEDDDESKGGAAGGRSRRGRRGAGQRRVPLLPIPGAPTDAQADPLAAARAAAENTRAALQALQQGAAGLGLSPEALAESVARLQDILPKLDALGSQPGTASDGDAAGASAAPGLPPAVSQLATNLVSSLGTVGSGLSDQLRKALGAAPPAAELTAAPSGETAVAATNGNGTTDVVAKANGGGGLLSGLLSSIVGVSGGLAPLPPGCVRLVAGAHMIPHVDKVDKGGEDAYFISRVGLGGVAVADGVSGWADEGIDPAEYPRTLMRYAADAYEMARGTMEARDIIRYAQYRTYLKGSSTVCMALMKPGRKLEVANVGDSGVRILRNGKVIFGTEAQQHSFNMPFQLSHPNNVEDPDSAEDADVQELDVQEGDVVMLATDGLFDNVFDEEIEQIVSAQLRELAAAGRGKQPAAAVTVTATAATATTAAAAGTAATASNEAVGVANGGAANGAPANGGGGSSSGAGSSGGGGGGRGGKGLLSQSFSAAAAAAAAASAGAAANGGAGGSGMSYRPEDAARVARALAERAHQHARNPTQRTPWSVTSSQQPNFMWAKFFAKGGGKMDDCTVLVAFVCGPE